MNAARTDGGAACRWVNFISNVERLLSAREFSELKVS